MNPYAKYKNLEQVLTAVGGPVKLLRSSPIGPYVFPVVPPEFTNWREEQRAWKEACALLNLSYHMTDLYIKGPDCKALLSKVGLTKLGAFPVNRGKQLIASSHDGYMIGDGICFHLEEDLYRVVGPPVISDWVQFHAETGGFNVEVDRDETVAFRPGAPRIYIYQIQGPLALQLMKEVTKGTLPEIGFFHIGEFTIEGKRVRALRHGMAGEPGFEMFGPWEDAEVIMSALERTGEQYGMKKIGALAYPTTTLESGWMPLPVPAVYHSEEMKAFREWCTPNHIEVLGSVGGSFYSDNITDYYMDPVELGHAQFIDFNRDFIGRDALVEKVANQKRKKVTLVWNQDDMMDVVRTSMFPDGTPSKFMNMPLSVYSTFQCDSILKNGKQAGLCQYSGYSVNAQAFLSLSVVDLEYAEPGTEVTILWGEENSWRPTVEKNKAREVRATVAPAPYFQKTIKKD